MGEGMINPANSPWNKPKPTYIADKQLYFRWFSIKKYLTTDPKIYEGFGTLSIMVGNEKIFIAKNSQKFRLKSHLDWAYYTPKTLADAIDNDSIESYYEIMLKDVKSDPNDWKDKDFELELKSLYAARNKRASLI